MKELSTLYARTSTGAVQTWKIEVVGNKFRTHVGQLNGKIVESEFTVCEGKNPGKKNETTGEQQAYKEAEAKWKKKIKREGYFESIDEIDNVGTFIEPMLAHRLVDHPDKVNFPCMVDRKYNGGRVIGTKDRMSTRKGETYLTIPHIFESLKPLFDKYPNLVIDGEGYNHDLRFKLNELMKILRTTKKEKITSELLKRSEDIVQYHVYDAYGFNDITEETGCKERRDAMTNLFKGIKYVYVVPYEIANNKNEINNFYTSYVDDGYEGAIVRNVNSPYEHKRSHNLLKVKPEMDSEATIIDINEGKGNWSGTGKVITLEWEGKRFDATFKGTFEQCKQFLVDKDEWIGKEVKFLYNDLTGLGVPNFARVDFDNCSPEK